MNRASPAQSGGWNRFNSIRARAALFACVVAVAISMIILGVSHYRFRDLAVSTAEVRLSDQTALIRTHLESAFETIRHDALTLVKVPPLVGLMRSRPDGYDPIDGSSHAQWRARLETIFTALMRNRSDYLQIRFLDNSVNGTEIVRVNRSGAGYQRVAAADLQTKSGEPYFQAALRLLDGQVHITRATLNREFGFVSQPPTLVIRAIVPVSDEFGDSIGYIVINVDYEAFLQSVLDRVDTGKDIYLVDIDGLYVSRLEDRDTTRLTRLSEDDGSPEIAAILGYSGARGTTRTTLHGHDAVVAYERVTPDPVDPSRYIAVAQIENASMLYAEAREKTFHNAVLSLALIIVFTALAYLAARGFSRPLEQIVEEMRAYRKCRSVPDLPRARRDEIGELSRAFSELVEDLDATQRRASRSDSRLGVILENTAEGLISIDVDGTIIDYRGGCEQIFGYPEAEAVGANIDMLMDGDFAIAHHAGIQRHIETGSSSIVGTPMRVTARRRNGTAVPVELTICETVFDGTKVYAALVRDCSERVAYEKAMSASADKLRLTLKRAPIGMALIRPNLEWVEFNDALCEMFGYSAEELGERDFVTLTHPEDTKIVTPHFERILAGEISGYQTEKRYRHKSGRTIWALLSVTMLNPDDGISPVIICQLVDISDSKEMEEMKSEFVSVISHELRTPLTSVRGSLGLILGAMEADLTPRVKQLISIAHSNCERLIPLINDILDMDKVAAGKMRFDFKDLQIGELIETAVESNRAFADRHDVRLVCLPNDTEARVHVDEGRFLQVLSNLISNAAKFTRPGTQVTVTVSVREQRVRISVIDRGEGVPPEFRDAIFSRFAQADASATRKAGGTGLGLYISKQIMEAMDGSIGFDSIDGEGATFWVELPMCESSVAGKIGKLDAHTKNPVAERHAYRVLHVEDDTDFARMFAMQLEPDCEVETVATIDAARTAIARRSYDLFILDPNLGTANALDLLGASGGPISEEARVVVLGSDSAMDAFVPHADALFIKATAPEWLIASSIMKLLHGSVSEREAV